MKHDHNKVFDLMVALGHNILDQYYPEDIFTGESNDPGPKYIVALRNALKELEKEDE